MLGSEILDIVIGLIFIYLLLSVIVSAMREGLEAWVKDRAVMLERGIRELLQDPGGSGLAKDLYEHPLVSGLYIGSYRPGGRKLPSYIPSSSFALALLDLVARGRVPAAASAEAKARDAGARPGDTPPAPPETSITMEALRRNAAGVSPQIQRVLMIAMDGAEGDLARLQAGVEAWFNSSMERVSSWYKRLSGRRIVLFAAIVTISMNVNTITLVQYLSHEKGARDVLVQRAGAIARDSTILSKNFQEVNDSMRSLSLPMGWDSTSAPAAHLPSARPPWSSWDILGSYLAYSFRSLVGWLATIFAISLGAPFWFDMLNKVIAIRSAVKPREPGGDGTPGDRPPAPPPAALRLPARPPPVSVAVATVPFEPHEWASGDPQRGAL